MLAKLRREIGPPRLVDPAGEVEVADLEVPPRRVGAEAERAVGAGEITTSGVRVGHRRDAHVRRHVVLRAELVADHAAEARKLQRRARAVAGEHVVRAALVGGLAVRHRAHDRDLVTEHAGHHASRGRIRDSRCAAGERAHFHPPAVALEIIVAEQRDGEARGGRPAVVGAQVETGLLAVVVVVLVFSDWGDKTL